MESPSKSQNPRPDPGSPQLPMITLGVLVALIVALLYIGRAYIADTTDGAEELTSAQTDSTAEQPLSLSEPEVIQPEEADTSGTSDPNFQEQISQEPVSLDNTPTEAPTNVAPTKTPDETPKPAEPERSKPEKEAKTPDIGGKTWRHTADKGETFYSIAQRYNLKVSTLKSLNPDLSEDGVKSGVTRVNVRVKASHVVGPGDVLRVVAQKYGVSVDALMKANGKTKNHAERGEKLVIPFAEKK